MYPSPPDLLARGVPPTFLAAFDTYCAADHLPNAFVHLHAPFAQWTGHADDPQRVLNEGLVAMLLHLGGMEHKATDFFRGTNTGAARICGDVVADARRRDRARRLLVAHLMPSPPPRRQSHPAQQPQSEPQPQSPPSSGQRHSQTPSPHTRANDANEADPIRHRPRFASLPVIPLAKDERHTDGADTDKARVGNFESRRGDITHEPWPDLANDKRNVDVDSVLEKRLARLEKRLADVEEREKRVTAREERVAEREGRVAEREERLAEARDRMVDERERRISEG